jgi:hypothetical protein
MISPLGARSISAVVLFCMLAIVGFSQTFRGGITGTVSDRSGAAAAASSIS